VRFRARRNYADTEDKLRKFKDLKACIAKLQAVLAGDSITPEQRQSVEQAIERLKQLRRIRDPHNGDCFRCVKDVTELLLKGFYRD
jgi:hypothetical protein